MESISNQNVILVLHQQELVSSTIPRSTRNHLDVCQKSSYQTTQTPLSYSLRIYSQANSLVLLCSSNLFDYSLNFVLTALPDPDSCCSLLIPYLLIIGWLIFLHEPLSIYEQSQRFDGQHSLLRLDFHFTHLISWVGMYIHIIIAQTLYPAVSYQFTQAEAQTIRLNLSSILMPP